MDLDPIIRAGVGLAALVGILHVVRIAIVPDGVGFGDLFGTRADLDWPRGVQEEEPVRWHPEWLTPWREPGPTRHSSATKPVTDVDRGSPRRSGGLRVARRPRG